MSPPTQSKFSHRKTSTLTRGESHYCHGDGYRDNLVCIDFDDIEEIEQLTGAEKTG